MMSTDIDINPITPFLNVSAFKYLRFPVILNRFYYSVFTKKVWHENGGVSITPILFAFISFALFLPPSRLLLL